MQVSLESRDRHTPEMADPYCRLELVSAAQSVQRVAMDTNPMRRLTNADQVRLGHPVVI